MELRDTVQRWSSNAAAGADSWKRCEWKQFPDAVYDQVADYLNNIEEVACGLSFRELIEVRPITLAATLYCAWSSTRFREAMMWAKMCFTKQCTEEFHGHECRMLSGHCC